jgi:hypothetical protein
MSGSSNIAGSTVTFTCKDGYRPTISSPSSWPALKASYKCLKKAVCPKHSATNGTLTGGKIEADTVTFGCNGGYTLVGSGSLTCLSTGKWSALPPKCLAKCLKQSSPTNGALSGGNSVGSTVTFKCNAGYKVVGAGGVVGALPVNCGNDSKWSAKLPTCAPSLVNSPKLSPPTE